MPHPISHHAQFDFSCSDRAAAGRRLVRDAREWGFIALSWITMIGLFVCPTLHIIALFIFSIWGVMSPDRSRGRRTRDPW
jgi:hypothetical protein